MKKYFTFSIGRKLVFAIALIVLSNLSYAQTWNWATSGAGSNSDYSGASCTDASGNIIATGHFLSSPLQMGTVTLNNAGGYDSYIAKYDANGNVLWAQKIGGTSNEFLSGVSVDASGNIYVVGTYNSAYLTIAPLPTISNFTNNLTYDIFVACYNSAGVVQWLKSYGGALDEGTGGCVYSNSLSCLYIGGNYNSKTLAFGTTTLTNTDNTGAKTDMYLARFTNAGAVTWAKTTGAANSNDGAQQLAIDSNSDLYYSGYFAPNSVTTTIGSTVVTSYGGQDMLVGKYNFLGTPIWVKNFGSSINCSCDFGGGISINSANDIFLSGTYTGASLVAGTFTLTNSGGYDSFTAKTNSLGVFQWASKIGGSGDQYSNAVSSDNNGNMFVTGSSSGTNVIVGTTTITNSTPGTSTDIYVLKYNNSGTAIWALSAAGANTDEQGNDISCDASGNIYVSGVIYTSPTSFGSTTLTNSGANDVFLAKIGCLTPTISGLSTICAGSSATLTATGATSYTWNTSAVSSSIVVTPSANASYSLVAVSGSCSANSLNYSVSVLPASVNAGLDINLGCSQKSLINATCNPTNPTSVVWSPTIGLSNSSVLTPSVTAPTTPSQYVVTCTLSNGCVKRDTVMVSPSVPKPDICIVSVDSLDQNNEIYWDKLAYPMLDSMIIFREVTNNVYRQIGAVHRSAISLFVDTVRHIGPSNGDPHISTYRYKIQIRDTCGVYGPKSLWHNTVFFTHTGSTFFWVNNYMIEGPTNPVVSYSLIVCPNPTVNPAYQLVGTTAGNQSQLNDPNYTTYQNTADWRVVAYLGYYCYAQRMTQSGKSTQVTRSNISNNRAAAPDIGVRENNFKRGIHIYPNPAEKFVTVDFESLTSEVDLKMTDIIGKVVYTEKVSGTKTIDVSNFSKGVYMLSINNAGSKYTYKVIVQ